MKGKTGIMETLVQTIGMIANQPPLTADDIILKPEGTVFKFPENADPDDVAKAAIKYAESMNKIISFKEPIHAAIPTEAAIVLTNTIKEKYPMLTMKGDMSFFGYKPPEVVSITISPGETHDIFLGNLILPGFSDNEVVRVYIGNTGVLLECTVRRKREAEVKALIAEAQEVVRTSSIFRQKAVQFSDVEWYDSGNYDIVRDTPVVFNLDKVDPDRLILNEPEEMAFNARVMGRIINNEGYAKLGRKRGGTWLFSGPYGTGKSYSISVAMKEAVARGWTVIQFDKASQFNSAVKIALAMQEGNKTGILMVIEDVELALPADKKDEFMTELSNLLDGTNKAFGQTMLIMTTNNVENIHPLFLRRTEIIHFDMPNRETRIKLIKQYTDGWCDKKVNFERVADEMILDYGDGEPVDFPPVFIERVCDVAIEQAIFSNVNTVSEESLLNAIAVAKSQVGLIYKPKGRATLSIEDKIARAVYQLIDEDEEYNGMLDMVADIHESVA